MYFENLTIREIKDKIRYRKAYLGWLNARGMIAGKYPDKKQLLEGELKELEERLHEIENQV